jgi:hypothetical protein
MPVQPLVAADDLAPAGPDDGEAFLLQGLQGDSRRLSADAVLLSYFWLGWEQRSGVVDSFGYLPPQVVCDPARHWLWGHVSSDPLLDLSVKPCAVPELA